jgi:hypothetical protein
LELLASYFAYDYLYKKDPETLRTYKIVATTFAKEYKPRYRSISEFNDVYIHIGRANYSWFNCMLFQMIEEIYSKYKFEFLDSYTATFNRIYKPDPRRKLSEEEITKNFDEITGSIYSKWIKRIEENSVSKRDQ